MTPGILKYMNVYFTKKMFSCFSNIFTHSFIVLICCKYSQLSEYFCKSWMDVASNLLRIKIECDTTTVPLFLLQKCQSWNTEYYKNYLHTLFMSSDLHKRILRGTLSLPRNLHLFLFWIFIGMFVFQTMRTCSLLVTTFYVCSCSDLSSATSFSYYTEALR